MTDVFGSGHPILTFLNGLAKHTPWLHGAAAVYADWLGVALLAFVLVVAWWRARSRNVFAVTMAIWTGGACLIGLGVNQVIAHAVAEERPYFHLRNVLRLVPVAHDYSFPSDHSVVAGAIAMGLLLFDRRLGIVATVLGLLLAADRVYVGAHYGHDVIAGLLIGAVVVVIGRWVVVPWLARIAAWLAMTALWPLVVNRRALPRHWRLGSVERA
ncbi:MAG: phosphatase PAP2 family protein [Acidothermus sp.]|nr:phosphatase PAP2 family protein [Acidothermus sp.]MCL6538540.1 phosphatase PAP2 family protein [Acidothermus sp.]